MHTKTKDTLKHLIELHISHLTSVSKSGAALSDGEHTALALHALTLQMSEVSSALGRIYMALEKANLLDEQCVR